MRKTLFIILCAFSAFSLKGQVNLDSLYAVWQDPSRPDSLRSNAYSDYIWDGYLFSNPDTAFIMAQELVDFGLEKQYLRARFAGYTLQGVSWVNRSDYPKTLDYYIKALDMAKKMGHPAALAIAHNNVGSIYHDMADFPKALDHYMASLEYNETRHMGLTLGNIAGIYLEQENFEKALEYINRSVKFNQQKGDQGEQAGALAKIGEIYRRQEDYSKSLDFYTQSLKIYEQIGHQIGIANSYNNIGLLYDLQEDYSMALFYQQKSLEIYQQTGDKNGIAVSLNNIGDIYRKQGAYNKALDHCKRAYEIALNINSLFRKKASCLCLYDTYKAMGNNNQALHYLEILKVVEDSMDAKAPAEKLQQMEFQKEAQLVQTAHKKEVREKERTRNVAFGVGIFLFLMAIGFYLRWSYIRKAKARIEKEKDRSENLLLNILPEEIAQELKEKGKAEARDFDMVSILFTDFKDFTRKGSQLSATELVHEINYCFEAFDAIIEKYGIEKIKTIGDAYMAAGGLPVPSTDSVKKTVHAALEMQEFITKRKLEMDGQGKQAFEMRLGIHTGPVVAGIVGVKRLQYDIWGDTVNTASRMESSGEVGKVNISQSTYALIGNDPGFTFEHRGRIAVKGKDEMEMYFVSKK